MTFPVPPDFTVKIVDQIISCKKLSRLRRFVFCISDDHTLVDDILNFVPALVAPLVGSPCKILTHQPDHLANEA